MRKKENTTFSSYSKWSWLLIGLLLSMGLSSATAGSLVESLTKSQDDKQLQAQETWVLVVPSANISFLQVENDGFDTTAKVFDNSGRLISQSTSWRGREGRYLLALEDAKGNRAATVEIKNTENSSEPGEVKVTWLQPDPGLRSSISIAEGLSDVAIAGNLHATHDQGADAHQRAADAYHSALMLLGGTEAGYWAADIHFELGVINRHLGLLREAGVSNQHALDAFQSLGDTRGMAAANNALGIVAYQLSEYDEAINYFNRDLDIRAADLDAFSQARAHNNIALAYWQIDQYQEAIEAYQQALSLFASGRSGLSIDEVLGLNPEQLKVNGNLSTVATALNNLALAKGTIGEVDQAEALWGHAVVLAEVADSASELARAELNLGKLYIEQGRLEQALNYSVSAADYYTETNNDYWLAEALTGIGKIYASIDEQADAISCYQRAQDLAGEDQKLQSSLLRLLANANWRLGNMALAESQFSAARDSFIQSNQPSQAAVVDSEYSMFLLEQGQGKIAIQNQRQAFSTLQVLGDIRNAARAQSRLGQLLLADGQKQAAEQELQSALKGHRAVSDELYELDTLTALSRAKNGVAALGVAKAATELANTIRTRTNSADIQTSFLASRRDAFEQYINLLVDAGDIEQAWNVNEQIRARTLLDLIQDANNPDNRLAAISINLDMPTLQQELDSDVAMLSYFLGEQRSHLWVIGQDSMEYYPLPAANQINLAANELTEVLRSHRQSPSRIAYVAGQLSEMVLQPAAAAIADRELVVIADGGLQSIPFALLPMDSSNAQNATLITETNVTYTPSARIFNLLNEHSSKSSSDILVLADPLSGQPANGALLVQDEFADANIDFSSIVAQRSLSQTGVNLTRLPGARLEAQAIADTASRADYRNTIKVMTGAQANHDFVMSGGLRNYGVLHFATHGVVDADMPELSGLVLAQEPESQTMSYLRPHQIAALELDADLVVLSGCETGIGKSVGSEGLFSLSRPFLIAGAKQVISSLWQVSDRATAVLMERFYFHLLEEDQSPEVALRSAQQWLSSQSEWEHPYFWAGFVVQGGRNVPAVNQQYADAGNSTPDTDTPPPTLVNAAL